MMKIDNKNAQFTIINRTIYFATFETKIKLINDYHYKLINYYLQHNN